MCKLDLIQKIINAKLSKEELALITAKANEIINKR